MTFQNNSEFTMWLFYKFTFIRSLNVYYSNFGNKNEVCFMDYRYLKYFWFFLLNLADLIKFNDL